MGGAVGGIAPGGGIVGATPWRKPTGPGGDTGRGGPAAGIGGLGPPGAMMMLTFMPFFARPPDLRGTRSPTGRVPSKVGPPSALCRLFKVFARFARRASFGLSECAALASFFAGIFLPSGTPSCRCSAPGCLIAPLIQLPPPDARATAPQLAAARQATTGK